MIPLLDQFLQQECTPRVRAMLEAAIVAARAKSSPQRARFEISRFEVTIDVGQDLVLLEDVLDASTAGHHPMSVSAFCAALARSLLDHLERWVRSRGAASLEIGRVELGGVERLLIERLLEDHTRYLRITPLEAGAVWPFEIRGGRKLHENPNDNFDSLCGGDEAFVQAVITRWLLLAIPSWEQARAEV